MRRISTIGTALVVASIALVAPPAAAGDARPASPPPAEAAPSRTEAPPMAITWGAGTRGSDGSTTAPAADASADSAPGSAAARAASPAPETTPSAAATGAPTTEFELQFDPSVTESQKTVFRAAAEIWAGELVIRVPVTIAVTFASLPPGALGGAAPTSAWVDEPKFPDSGTAYVVALANQHVGRDLDPGVADIDVVVSTQIDFYEGTDANVPSDKYSLLLLALHELGHGLGHTTWARETSTNNFAVTVGGVPLSYDRFVTYNGRSIAAMGTSELGTALRSNALTWNGTEAARRSGSSKVLYAPSSWEQGSSVGHSNDPTQLMYPFVFKGDSYLSIPTLTVGHAVRRRLAGPGGRAREVRRVDHPRLPRPLRPAHGTAHHGRPPSTAARAGSTSCSRYAYSDEWVGGLVDGYYQSTLGRRPRRQRSGLLDLGHRPGHDAGVGGGVLLCLVRVLHPLGRHQPSLGGGPLPPDPPPEPRRAAASPTGPASPTPAWAATSSPTTSSSRSSRVATGSAALSRACWAASPTPAVTPTGPTCLKNGRDVELAIFLAGSDEYNSGSRSRFR